MQVDIPSWTGSPSVLPALLVALVVAVVVGVAGWRFQPDVKECVRRYRKVAPITLRRDEREKCRGLLRSRCRGCP